MQPVYTTNNTNNSPQPQQQQQTTFPFQGGYYAQSPIPYYENGQAYFLKPVTHYGVPPPPMYVPGSLTVAWWWFYIMTVTGKISIRYSLHFPSVMILKGRKCAWGNKAWFTFHHNIDLNSSGVVEREIWILFLRRYAWRNLISRSALWNWF